MAGKRNRPIEKMNWRDALFVGIAQVLAIFPGASRSGTTISAGMARGLDRPSSARFAFPDGRASHTGLPALPVAGSAKDTWPGFVPARF